MQAWCTYVSTKEFIIPALTLGENLKQVGSKYPLVIAMTKNVYDPYNNIIKQMGCIPELINTTEYNEELQNGFLKDHRLLKTSSRVSVFKLTRYSKLVFMDCDVFIPQNVDELFNYPDGSMVVGDNPEEGGYEGLLVFIPKNHQYGIYPYLISHLPMMTDELFSELWFPVKSNPDYQIPIQYFYDYEAYMQTKASNIKIYHGSQVKFWDMTPDYKYYDSKQRELYMEMYNQTKNTVNSLIDKLYS